MPRLNHRLLAGGAAMALLAGGACAQSTRDSSPHSHVSGQPPATGEAAAARGGTPAETRPANAPDQRPAFPGQTRAPQPGRMPQVAVATFAENLPHLWAMQLLPDGRALVTAKRGALHVVPPGGPAGPPIEGVPAVASGGQGGLLDVALAPDFARSGRIAFSYAEPRQGGNGTSVATATLRLDAQGGGRLEDLRVIFRQMPTYDGDKHFGSRLVFSPDGFLYVGVGERSDAPIREQAQDLGSGLGKVFRINPDGGAAPGNPFLNRQGALPEIWSYGHRNIQSAALDAQGRLWTVEHGPRGGDELNRPQPGRNYGWPVITYGVEYSGRAVGQGRTAREGMEQPAYYWDPVIGPSGMALYQGEMFPEWRGAFLIGGLVSTGLVILQMDGDRVATEARLPLRARIRDVRVGPDGAVYAVTETRGGSSSILRLTRGGGS